MSRQNRQSLGFEEVEDDINEHRNRRANLRTPEPNNQSSTEVKHFFQCMKQELNSL
jgi:hypothetical protein